MIESQIQTLAIVMNFAFAVLVIAVLGVIVYFAAKKVKAEVRIELDVRKGHYSVTFKPQKKK